MRSNSLVGPSPESVARLVEYLRSFQKRTRMYVETVDVASVTAWLGGFATACHALGIRYAWAEFEGESIRGWRNETRGIEPALREAGFDDARMIDELIEIEIALLLAATGGERPQTN